MRRKKITKEMGIGEVIKKYPKTTFVFLDYGLHCISCPMAKIINVKSETVEEAAGLHRIDIKKLLKDLNKAANQL